MKNKPIRHKESNTFKFQPFSERIANIDVDVFHRVGHRYEEESEDIHTFFRKTLEKWRDLNLTESFEAFQKELPLVHTLPQLLQQKDEVVLLLKKYLKLKNPLSLQPVLELVVAFAQDLRQEFYPYYTEFLEILFSLLNTKDPEQLEWTFTCLAYLFKFLWRYLVKDVRIVFTDLLPLLADTQPEYINNFAAESFAFVARKVKDKRAFLLLVLKTLKKHPDGIAGCGQLLFEVTKGVSGSFHSCAEVMIPLLFEMLGDVHVPQNLLYQVLTHVVKAMVSTIHPKKSGLFWTSAFNAIEGFKSAFLETESENKSEALSYMLRLVLQIVKYKEGMFITDPGPLTVQLLEVYKCESLPENAFLVTSEISAALLMSHNIKLAQEHASRLTIKTLAVAYPVVLLKFVEKIFRYPGFEVLILPQFLQQCQRFLLEDPDLTGMGLSFLRTLTKLLLHKSPPCKTGLDIMHWRRYPLHFTSRSISNENADQSSVSELILKQVNAINTEDLLTNMEQFVCGLICLPHIKLLDWDQAKLHLRNSVTVICKALIQEAKDEKSETDSVDTRNEAEEDRIKCLFFLLATLVETTVHLPDGKSLQEVCDVDLFLDTVIPYASDPKYPSSLRALDLYLTAYGLDKKEEEFCLNLLQKLHSKLVKNLSSPYHEIRLLTSHIFALFEQSVESTEGSESILHWLLFSLCLAAELAPPTIQEYREKLQHLQNLEFTATQASVAKDMEYSKVPLHYLLGVLYINFQLLWAPTTKLIASYAKGMPLQDFWAVYKEHLQLASKQAKQGNPEDPAPCFTTESEIITQLYSSLHQLDDRPDFMNYRILLWKAMQEFAEISESRNRDITPLFLEFLEDEYFRINSETSYMWNVKKKHQEMEKEEDLKVEESMEIETLEASTENNDTNKETKDEDIDELEIDDVKKELEQEAALPQRFHSKTTAKTLLAFMGLFAKVKDPRSMYREPELKKVYLDFLMHKNPDVQKMALDCLMTYKFKYMLPYKEHLYGLIEDKSFKTEITLFRIDKESELIQEEHRNELIPVIMRIVYSKMLTRTGSRTSGKSGGQVRRSVVLRFLAGCHEEEMVIFVQMAFKVYGKFIQDDPVAMVDNILSSLDLEKVYPPKRLQSSLNLLTVVLSRFGRLMGQKLLPYLLRVLLCIAATVLGVLLRRTEVHPGYVPTLLTLRNTCQEMMSRFFDHFENYVWTEQEIDTVFRVFVWPWLEKLPVEGIHSPTGLLKIFLVWSKNPRYFALLAKHAENNEKMSPLPYIMDLLVRSRTHPSVCTAIMELAERMLTLQDHQMDTDANEAAAVPAGAVVPIDEETIAKLSLTESLNYGSCLLLPHIPTILAYLEKKLGTSKNRTLAGRDLSVLSRATELVMDASTSDTLLRLLLPILVKRAGAGEEVVTHLILTLDNLVKNVTEPEKHIRLLAPLFGEVSAFGPRKQLLGLLETIAKRSSMSGREARIEMAKIVAELNAYDAKWVEQPDFNRRLDAFKKLHDMLENNRVSLELGVIVIYNCFHFIRSEKDLSLKDSAGYCLRKIAPALCLRYRDSAQDREFLVSTTVLCLLRTGIRDKNESVRHESIALLGEMARECGDLHPILQDLSKLANKADPEVDFFENLLHLQSHRKSRALLKFCQVAKELTKAPNPRTLTYFILPLASLFLCSDKFAQKNSIVDAAIETVGTACRLLPWHQYETILRFYLTKLRRSSEYQKQMVRIVVAILDAFHFDLSRANVSHTEVAEKNQEMDVDKDAPEETKNKVDTAVEDAAEETLELEELEAKLETLPEPEEENCKAESESATEVETLPPAVSRKALLTKSVATHAVHMVATGLLPQVHRVMAQHTQAELGHKLSKKHTAAEREEEELLRVPIALAAVKLLQQLPQHMLDRNLPGIFMKLCTFLKSRLESTRRVTRETLQKIMVTLGPKYLGMLVHEMSALLTRGYQIHVLIFTIHAVIVSLKSKFQPGDVDTCLQSILELCKKDLFGAVAEEKEVSQITGKIHEARSTKSYDTFQILGQFISEKCLTDLILPIKEVLIQSHSFKEINKCSECLRKVVLGLADNTFVTVESLLVFTYGTASESIPDLKCEEKKPEITPAQKELLARQRTDIFLIPKPPRSKTGSTVVARTSARTNAYMLVEFGLRLLHILLKRERLRSGDFRPYLDPLVPILRDCLTAQHVKLTTVSLNCLSWVLKVDLPSLKENVTKITDSIFKLLHKYASAGLSKGDNFDMVVAAFKTVTVLVRDVKYHTIDTDQLKALLFYAEQDMYDLNRHATAFSLLKAILSRKLVVPEMHEVMKKVAELSITSEFAHIRLQSRQVFHQFLMDYPLGKKLEKHVLFYLAQFKFELQSGRESALEMVQSMITSFPQNILKQYCSVLYTTLGVRLVQDDSPLCKRMAARCIETMLERLDKNSNEELYRITLVWLEDKEVIHRRLAAQLCGIFVVVEKSGFESRLEELLPLVIAQFNPYFSKSNEPGRFVRIAPSSDNESDKDEDEDGDEDDSMKLEKKERARDYLLFIVLQLLLKLCVHCPSILRDEKFSDHMETCAENAHSLLSYPHEWVRLGAAQLLGHMFSTLDVNKIARLVSGESGENISRTESGYFHQSTKQRLKSLVLDLCAQLQCTDVRPEIVEQVVKDLVFLGRVLRRVSLIGGNTESEEEGDTKRLSLLWMIRRMRKIANLEIIKAPKSTTMRTAVFKWIGAMVLDLGKEGLPPLLHQLLAPLSRELSSNEEQSEGGKQLIQLAKQVSELMKKKVGVEVYMRHLSRLQTTLASRRADRKKLRAQEVLTEPEKAAKRKIKKHLKKREVKKRKIEKRKGKKFRRKKATEFTIEEIC